MLAFFIFLIVLMLIELCWKSDEILASRNSKEYHIIVIKQTKETVDNSDIGIGDPTVYGKNRISH